MLCTVCTMQIAKWSSHTSFFLYIPFNSHISTTVVWAWNIDATSAAWFYLLINYICGSKFIPAFPCRFLQFHFPNNTHMNKLDVCICWLLFFYIFFFSSQTFSFNSYARDDCTPHKLLSYSTFSFSKLLSYTLHKKWLSFLHVQFMQCRRP